MTDAIAIRDDVPGLQLFPDRHPGLEEVTFRAGMAVLPVLLGMWTMSPFIATLAGLPLP